jgi:hypothetical protein
MVNNTVSFIAYLMEEKKALVVRVGAAGVRCQFTTKPTMMLRPLVRAASRSPLYPWGVLLKTRMQKLTKM